MYAKQINYIRSICVKWSYFCKGTMITSLVMTDPESANNHSQALDYATISAKNALTIWRHKAEETVDKPNLIYINNLLFNFNFLKILFFTCVIFSGLFTCVIYSYISLVPFFLYFHLCHFFFSHVPFFYFFNCAISSYFFNCTFFVIFSIIPFSLFFNSCHFHHAIIYCFHY